MAYLLIDAFGPQIEDANGNPLSGGSIEFYQAGTSTPATVYFDNAGGSGATSTSLNSEGYPQTSGGTEVSLYANTAGTDLKFIIKDSLGATLKTIDNYRPGGDGLLADLGNSASASLGDALIAVNRTLANTPATTLHNYIERMMLDLEADFGATGDGVADDTTVISNAIASGFSFRGKPGSTYKTTSAITFSNLYQVFDLNGATIAPAGTFDAVNITQSYTGIINGLIDASGLTGRVIYAASAVQHLVLRDIEINDPGTSTAVELVDIFNSWIDRLQVTGHAGRAIHVWSNTSGTPVNSVWLTNINVSGGTTTGDNVLIEAASGVYIDNGSFQNNASGGNVIRIKSTTNAGVSGITIFGCYFEDGVSHTGNAIFAGTPTSGLNNHIGIKIIDNTFQTSKQPVNFGTYVDQDAVVAFNQFTSVSGGTTYGVSASGGLIPDVHSNTGSLADINRLFTPALQFGGAAVGMTGTFTGRYYRMGNKVSGDVRVVLTAKGSSTGSAVITGMPVSSNAEVFQNTATIQLASNMASLTSAISGRIGASSTGISLGHWGATGTTDLNEGNFTNTSDLNAHFEYLI